MKFIFIILLLIILADRAVHPISISSEYVSAKQLSIGVNTEFTMSTSLLPICYKNPYTGENCIEQFRSIIGYEQLYQISDCGRIKSLERQIFRKNKNGVTWNLDVAEKILVPVNRGKYYAVNLSKNNKHKTFSIHQLVWAHFGNGTKNNKYNYIDHINGDKLNNYFYNLQILSPRENSAKYYREIKELPVGVWNAYNTRTKKLNGRYIASIYVNHKNVSLGSYSSIEQAEKIYLEAREEYTRTGAITKILEYIRSDKLIKRNHLPKGVSMNRDKFTARLEHNGKILLRKTFNTVEEASQAYQQALKLLAA